LAQSDAAFALLLQRRLEEEEKEYQKQMERNDEEIGRRLSEQPMSTCVHDHDDTLSQDA
jgi:hypothetical protein